MIAKIVIGPYLNRLDNIIQWQEKDVFKRESVSQHSYKVFVFSRILLEDIFGKNDSKELTEYKLRCVTLSGFHDWDEAILLRDLSHEIKYNSHNGDELRKVLNDYSSFEASEEFNENGKKTPCYEMLMNCISPKDSGVKLFCKFCDWLALLFFIRRENSIGNHSLDEQWNLCLKSLSDLVRPLRIELTSRFPEFELNFDIINDLLNELEIKWKRN